MGRPQATKEACTLGGRHTAAHAQRCFHGGPLRVMYCRRSWAGRPMPKPSSGRGLMVQQQV
eukprot:CAMPEP_0171224588 /NCGR_PEP_ID=MMETSP0790-20130122/36367_1 /TAXON_ID=2925 /ORGANISM="Alexandrium catenella, Strain OF101" /LENGTH=60 /DNA_ID=CAMNT_0011690591 /DNA_START=57 /DNA_END=235 /DNA_ORIENTATION=-